MPATSLALPLSTEEVLRRQAERILRSSGPRLAEVLHCASGEDGLALAYAFRDIVLDRDMPAASWPISDVLAALGSIHARQDSQSAALAACLAGLLRRVDALEMDGDWADQTWEGEEYADGERSIPRAA